jgi:protoporphyrinogen oxidase
MDIYDYVIIGAGPTGLTLAYLLSKYNKKVILIDKEYIGGCHGVERVDGLFSEHGPRIYIDNFHMFKRLLKEIGGDFNKIFTEYKFHYITFSRIIFSELNFREIFITSIAFLKLNKEYKKISLLDFVKQNNFSERAITFFDNYCRLVDGGGIENFTLHSFLQIVNQNALYKIYQPRIPNDVGFLKLWENKLKKNNVTIMDYTEVIDFKIENNKIVSININNKTSNNKTIVGNNFILAMPPHNINKLISKYKLLKYSFGPNFSEWSEKTNYITYIPVVFHWNKKINIKRKWGFPQKDWGIIHIILSEYMEFNDSRSQTVISASITKHEKSPTLNKTPDEISNKEEIIKEVFRQLQTIIDIPQYDRAIMSQNYYENNKWVSSDTAFMTTKHGYINSKSPTINNLYNCGVQNGKSDYVFTSIEAAIQNAVSLVHDFEPKSQQEYKLPHITTVKEIIFIVVLIIIIIIIIYRRKIFRNKSTKTIQ